MPRLRQEIAAEVAELKKKSRFSLVFEAISPVIVAGIVTCIEYQ